MSTRYVWGQYTRQTQTGTRVVYEETYETEQNSHNLFHFNMTDGQQYSIGSSYSFSTYSGSYSATNNRYYTYDELSGNSRGAGYIVSTSGKMYYSPNWVEHASYRGLYTGYNVDGNSYRIYSSTRSTETYTYYVQGSFITYLSSSSKNKYPSDDYSGSYWYTYQGSDNIDATSITLPETIEGGSSVTVTINPSNSIKYSGTITYTIQYKLNGGNWNTLISSTSTMTSMSIPRGTETVQLRVQAKDNYGFTSSTYVESKTYEVKNGDPPTIQWDYYVDEETDSIIYHNVGDVTEPFSFSYTPIDPDYDKIAVLEAVIDMKDVGSGSISANPLVYHTYENLSSGVKRTCNILNEDKVFLKIPADEEYGVILLASDEYEMLSKNYIVKFTKTNEDVTITLQNAMAVSGDITKGYIVIYSYIPQDALLSVKVTNNANDEVPVWQDVTDAVRGGETFIFENATVTNGSAFNFELYAKRGESGEAGYIDTIIGSFE